MGLGSLNTVGLAKAREMAGVQTLCAAGFCQLPKCANDLRVAALLGDTLMEQIASRAPRFQGRLHRGRSYRKRILAVGTRAEIQEQFGFRTQSDAGFLAEALPNPEEDRA